VGVSPAGGARSLVATFLSSRRASHCTSKPPPMFQAEPQRIDKRETTMRCAATSFTTLREQRPLLTTTATALMPIESADRLAALAAC
jgi:hypothetical protein